MTREQYELLRDRIARGEREEPTHPAWGIAQTLLREVERLGGPRP